LQLTAPRVVFGEMRQGELVAVDGALHIPFVLQTAGEREQNIYLIARFRVSI
jgi:hypothetical protein